MDVNPVSMQLLVPRSLEVSQLQNSMTQAAMVKQDYDAMREQTDARLKQRQVRTKDNAEGEKIKDDPDRGGRRGYYARGRGGAGREETEEEQPQMSSAADPLRGRRIDISY